MFDIAAVRRRLRSTRFANVRYVDETDSTNDDAAALLSDPAGSGTIIVAGYQRHGRGRRGRRWVAPPGTALLFSAVLPDAVTASHLWSVSFWCALAVSDGITAATEIVTTLQWPNDLLLGTRKVCGILTTSRVVGDLGWAACGVGLNVLRAQSSAEGEPYAAYLSDAASSVSREDTFVSIVEAMDRWLPALRSAPSVAREWERRAGLPGERYRVQIDGEPIPFEGSALRLDDDGALILRVNGEERRAAMAEARVLRT